MWCKGGERLRGKVYLFRGYSVKAQRTGKRTPSYLMPNIQTMQKRGRGGSLFKNQPDQTELSKQSTANIRKSNN